MRWTVGQLADALGVPHPTRLDPSNNLTGVSIDSRTIEAGELFLAIHGPRHDGHVFVAAALERGAGGAVVAHERLGEYPEDIRGRLFAVENTLGALHRLAVRAREIWRQGAGHRRIAAVAGSVGKTTTKEILAALLGAKGRVLKTQGNLNNEYGLPLTLLKLSDDYDSAVVELGMSHAGELALLTQIASPDAGVITRVAIEHLEFFSSIEEIALAERELIENLPWPNATAVLNADDERVAAFAKIARGPVIFFGSGDRGDSRPEFRAEKIVDRGLDGSAFDFAFAEGSVRLELPLIGRYNVTNAVAALAAASLWGIGARDAKAVFTELKPADKRGEVVRYEGGFSVINDTYNSSPTALVALAELLGGTPGYKRRILAAGEMLELGTAAPDLHRECGRMAAASKTIDWIFGVRGNGGEIVAGAIEAGHPRSQTQFFANAEEAGAFLETFVKPGDLLLLKGSRGVRMEKILDAIDARHKRIAAPVRDEIAAGERKGRG